MAIGAPTVRLAPVGGSGSLHDDTRDGLPARVEHDAFDEVRVVGIGDRRLPGLRARRGGRERQEREQRTSGAADHASD